MDKPEVILENTRKALIDFSGQLLKLESKNKKSDEEIDPKADSEQEVLLPGELWSCKFNRGLFAVNWADTRKILEEELKSVGKHVRVVSPATS